ncbi:hypothetical protein J3F83DRAFT_755143 [Trichoderma novae-zelandiae]
MARRGVWILTVRSSSSFCPALVVCVCTRWVPDASRWLLSSFYGVQDVRDQAYYLLGRLRER